jgi:WD40 repeat protein
MKRTNDIARRSLILILVLFAATLMLEPVALAQASGDWIPTGSLNIPRNNHTATLLPNGKVLVVGGANGAGPLSSAELYDPATGRWSITGSLLGARFEHTATLLPDGKVLVAAGGWNGGVLNSAELYDPTSGNWSVTGSLNAAHFSHTATLLPDGKVLIAGGGSPLNTAELFDPNTGTWSITASLHTGRRYHTATLLPGGKVLVTGGFTGGFTQGLCPCIDFVTNSAELYDPVTAKWSVTGNLNLARDSHTATLLQNGKVLIAGGTEGTLIDAGEYVRLASAELYDPATGSWTVTGSLHTARYYHTATLLSDEKVLVATGWFTDTAELYDPAKGIWSLTANLSTPGSLHTATLLLNGNVLVAGGTSELYDPTAEGTLPLTIGAPVLPEAEVGVAYSAALVSGGVPPYTINLVKGVLPPGLSDTPTSGALSGTPASTRTRSFSVQVTDDLGSSVTGPFTLKVLRALENHSSALKIGTNGRSYKATLKAAGGKRPYTWSLASGNLPAGLSLDSVAGVLFGIPTESGTFDLIFHVNDPVGGLAQTALTLTIK